MDLILDEMLCRSGEEDPKVKHLNYMKKNIFILVFIYCTIQLYSQGRDSIIYIFSDKIEQKLYEKIEENNSRGYFEFEFYLRTEGENRFRLTYTHAKSLSDNYWIVNTNRFILINKSKYPLYFDYDSMFSTSKPNEIGEYGHREGTIMKSIPIYDGYSIVFDKNGEFLEEDFGLQKKE